MATIKDIAKTIGVSKATVSNVLTKKKPVSEKITQKVYEVCKQLNYYPNRIASSLVTKKIYIIGLLLENSKDNFKKFYGDLINGVTTTASDYGYRVLIDTCTDDREKLHSSLISRADPIDGSVIHGPLLEDARMEEMVKNNIPFVIVGRTSDEKNDNVLCVDVNNVSLVYKMTSHLLRLGHKRIGFLNSKPNMTITFDRLKGYIKALTEYGIDFDPSLVYNNDHTVESGKTICARLMENYPEITALITSSDEVAYGAYDYLFSKGYKIPDDISVLALGGDDYIDKMHPRITTVLIDYKLLGRKATELLMKRLNNEPIVHNHIIVDVKILEGESCRICIKKDSVLQKGR